MCKKFYFIHVRIEYAQHTQAQAQEGRVKNDQLELHICSTYVFMYTHLCVTRSHISSLSLQINPFGVIS